MCICCMCVRLHIASVYQSPWGWTGRGRGTGGGTTVWVNVWACNCSKGEWVRVCVCVCSLIEWVSRSLFSYHSKELRVCVLFFIVLPPLPVLCGSLTAGSELQPGRCCRGHNSCTLWLMKKITFLYLIWYFTCTKTAPSVIILPRICKKCSCVHLIRHCKTLRYHETKPTDCLNDLSARCYGQHMALSVCVCVCIFVIMSKHVAYACRHFMWTFALTSGVSFVLEACHDSEYKDNYTFSPLALPST